MRWFTVPTKFSLKIYKLLSKGRPPRKWYVAIVKKARISTTTSIYEWKVLWNATTTILPNMNKNKTNIYNYAEYELESFAMNSSLTSSKPPQRSKKNRSRWSLDSTTMDPRQHAQTHFFTLNRLKQLAWAQHSLGNFLKPSHGSLNILY